MALPAMMEEIRAVCEGVKKIHPLQTVGGVPYCGSVVGTTYRHLAEGKPISDKVRGFPIQIAPFDAALELCLKCGEELQKAGVPLSKEALAETLALNWKEHYQIYDMVRRHPFEKVVLPKFPEPEPEPEPEPLRNPDALGLTVKDGRVVVSSRDVAKAFEKEHYNVVRDIKNLDYTKDFHALNFEGTSETLAMPNGGTRESPIYLMTRDGFVFLAMGYTGKRAAQFKEAYITRFNEMEQALAARHSLPEQKPARAEKVKRYYTPEEAAEALGLRGYRTFYATMVAAGYFVKTKDSYEPKPEYVKQKLFVMKWFRSGIGGCNKWRRPMVTHAGILYLSRLAIA